MAESSNVKKSDRNNQKSLEACLLSLCTLEDMKEEKQRHNTAQTVSTIVKCIYPDALVLPTGSTSLGTYLRGCDIDMLVVLKSINQSIQSVVTKFYEYLLASYEITGRINYTSGMCVLSFFYPKHQFISHKIDLIFADGSKIQDNLWNYKIAPTILMDIPSVRALNGFRVLLYLKSVIINKHSFRLALLAVKYWAKLRNCYGNRGKFAGIVWTVMMAKICKMFPRVDAPRLLYLFFSAYSNWPWPKPVVIESLEDGPNVIDRNTGLLFRDLRQSYMPVICPVYPYENMTNSVQADDAAYIIRCIKEAMIDIDFIIKGQRTWDSFLCVLGGEYCIDNNTDDNNINNVNFKNETPFDVHPKM